MSEQLPLFESLELTPPRPGTYSRRRSPRPSNSVRSSIPALQEMQVLDVVDHVAALPSADEVLIDGHPQAPVSIENIEVEAVAADPVAPSRPADSILPAMLTVEEVLERLGIIFRGMEWVGPVTGIPAARTVFTANFIDAVAGRAWLRPNHVVRMSTSIAVTWASDDDRTEFRRRQPRNGGWYADNSRESARDDVIRQLFIPLGVMLLKPGVPQNSSDGRYCLTQAFADLFNPDLQGAELLHAIQRWRDDNLSAESRARNALLAQGKEACLERVTVTYPDGRGRSLPPGPGPSLCKAIIESFSVLKLVNPVVVALTEGAKKLHPEDAEKLASVGLVIDSSVLLPDVILMDLGLDGGAVRLIFVEAAATGGPMTAPRIEALTTIATNAGFRKESLMFVTAFEDRGHAQAKKALPNIPIGSHAWFASEPSLLIHFYG